MSLSAKQQEVLAYMAWAAKKGRHGCPAGVFRSTTWDVLYREELVTTSGGLYYYLTPKGERVARKLQQQGNLRRDV